ncbi:MAG: VOC family protein [Solirubrobacterales bacterium]|nr:VOC family protein [Solirubrobacterales bacterium]
MAAQGTLEVGMYSFDCRDAAKLADFWSRVLERPVDTAATSEYATIGLDGEGPTWMFVRSADPGEGRNRLMLDLGGEDDWQQQADRVEGLGAERVADHQVDRVRWVEFRDPEGNTFRIFAPRPT